MGIFGTILRLGVRPTETVPQRRPSRHWGTNARRSMLPGATFRWPGPKAVPGTTSTPRTTSFGPQPSASLCFAAALASATKSWCRRGLKPGKRSTLRACGHKAVLAGKRRGGAQLTLSQAPTTVPMFASELEAGATLPEPSFLPREDEAGSVSDKDAALKVGWTSCAAYFLIYFTRYPILMLPASISSVQVLTVCGVGLSMQTAMSFAFVLGFGLAKFPAIPVMSSPLYMQNRCASLIVLNVAAGVLATVPFALTHSPLVAVIGLFLSAFPASWVFGGLATYLEGRCLTESLFAALTSTFIFAGSASRGAAQALLDVGVDPVWMPALLAAVTLPIVVVLLRALDTSPPPSQRDAKLRGRRSAMSLEECWQFAARFGPGLAAFMLAYGATTTLRQFRDLFARDLLTAAFGASLPSSTAIFFMDLGAAVAAFALLTSFSQIRGNQDALMTMIRVFFLLLTSAMVGTAAFASGVLAGPVWQVLMGVCIFGALACASGAFFDRLVACAGEKATCTFLIFVADLAGYAGAVGLFVWKTFGSATVSSSSWEVLQQFTLAVFGLGSLSALSLIYCMWYFGGNLSRKS